MMAMPNIRKMFIPTPGYLIAEVDLEQADARVVAWDAEDETLKAIFNDPTKDLHIENAVAIFGECSGKDDIRRQYAKQGVHLTNYAGSAYVLARTLNISVAQAERFQKRWFTAHPKVKRWQDKVQAQLFKTRKVRNAYGFQRPYFGRIEDLLKEALAWIPQSTVALTINQAMLNLEASVPEARLLLQVHDSIVFEYPKELDLQLRPRIREAVHVKIPYDDPLVIPCAMKTSALSWGHCEKVSWEVPNG